MHIRILALSAILSCEVFGVAHASQGVPAPTCFFTGQVTDVQQRQEAGQGMSEGETFNYIDVSMSITEGTNAGVHEPVAGCDIPTGSTQTFQMQGSDEAPDKGSCMSAQSKFFADGNFMSGNWLTVKEELPAERCAQLSQ